VCELKQPVGEFEQHIYVCNQNEGAVAKLRYLIMTVTDNVTLSTKHKVEYILIH